MKFNMFRAHTAHHQEPKTALAAHCAWQRPPTTRPTTFHVWKTRGCQWSFRLLMMGGVSPKTCWASYEYGIIKFWYTVASCWIFLYEAIGQSAYSRTRVNGLSSDLVCPFWNRTVFRQAYCRPLRTSSVSLLVVKVIKRRMIRVVDFSSFVFRTKQHCSWTLYPEEDTGVPQNFGNCLPFDTGWRRRRI